MSQRKLIREKIKNLLHNKTSCGAKVNTNRMLKWRPANLPCISIYSLSENIEIYNVSPRKYKRSLSLAVEIIVHADENIDDYLDSLCNEVESVLNASRTLDGTCGDFIFQGLNIGIAEDGGENYGCARLEYEATYFSNHTIDSSTLPDLHSIHNTMNVGSENLLSEYRFKEDEKEEDGEGETDE